MNELHSPNTWDYHWSSSMSKCTELLLYDLLIINSVNEKFNVVAG